MAKFTTANGKLKVTFEYTAATAQMTDILVAASKQIWKSNNAFEDPAKFTALTNDQKLEIINQYLQKTVLELARASKAFDATEAARLAAKADADTNVKFDG